MNDRIRGVHEPIVLIAVQTETGDRDVSAEHTDLGLQMLVETRKIHVELECAPQPELRFLLVAGADEQVQRGAVSVKKVGGDVCADVSGRSGQEYRHVAPLVPVFTASPLTGAS